MSVEEILAASKARLESLLAPVNGGVGDDVSYDSQFESAKNEVDKLQSLTGEQCNWGSVSSNATELLEQKSKDYRLVCFVAAAHMQDKTLQGLLDAVVLLLEFSKAFWEPCYPPLKRIRARAGIVAWLTPLAAPLKELKLATRDGDMVQAIEQVTGELEADLRDKLGELYPGLGELRDVTRHLARTCPKEAPPPPPTAAAPAGGGPGAASSAASLPPPAAIRMAPAQPVDASALTDVEQVERVLTNAGLLFTKIGGMLRAAKPENPAAYRFARFGMWLDLTEAPPTTDGRTLVPPPPDGLKSRFDSLLAANDLLTLINEAEDVAAEYVLWLDPHRYVAAAMDRMGALFLRAKEAMLVEVALLLRRVPTLPTLQFASGEPCADGPTKMWLDGEVAAVLGSGGGGGGGGGAGAEPSVLDEPLAQARELVVQGKLGEAMAVVREAVAAAPSQADRFKGQLAMAQLALQSGQPAIARAQLLGLHQEIVDRKLDTWQPSLCAEVYGALYQALKGVSPNPDATPPDELARQQQAFEHLCRLDPAAALKLGEGK